MKILLENINKHFFLVLPLSIYYMNAVHYYNLFLLTDTKDSQGVHTSNINEIAFNAVAVKWNPRESNVKV